MKQNIFTKQVVDHETGEVTQTIYLTKELKSADHFYKVYLQDLGKLIGLTYAQYRILHTLAQYAEFNSNDFFLNKERREQISETCNLKVNTLNQSISRLMKKNLIIKLGSNMYKINPTILFNGTEQERLRVLQNGVTLGIKYNVCKKC